MGFRNCLLIVFIYSNALWSQSFVGEPVNNFSKKLLDQKFVNYELVSLNSNQILAALNSRSNSHSLEIKTESVTWNLSLTEFSLFNNEFYLSVAGGGKVDKKYGLKNGIRTYKVLPNTKRAGLSCLTLADHFIYGYIEDAGIKTFIEPLNYIDPSAEMDQFIIYKETDVKNVEGIRCGSDELHDGGHIENHDIKDQIASRAGCITVDIALACDKTIYDNKGGISGSEAFVTGVLNNVQTNYDNEFNSAIEFSIATIFVATTTQDDPWNGINNINTHLDKHRTWANGGGYGGTSYAVATAWTRKYTSGAIGVAWLGALCGSFRYNVCSDFGGSAGLLRCLQAHELGHNFNAGHDGAGSGFIMAPAVSNSNTWSSASQSAINNYIKTIGCVGICNAGTPPVADFSGSPTIVCPNGTVKFIDESTGQPTTWQWTFPGGTPSTSTQQNPTVQYKTTGIYDVTLKVTNTFGSNTITIQKYIEVLPLVINSFTTYTIDRDLTTFNDCQFADSYLWKFGDGNTSTEDEPTHTYAKDGTFTVELCATNTCGTVCKTSKVIVVTPCEANFFAEVQDGCTDLKVKYRNLSSPNSTSFKWEFPGGIPSVSTEKEPTITYHNKGVFDAKLTASNSKYTNTKVEKGFIRADSKPESEFDVNIPVGNSVEFTNKTIDTIRPWKYAYYWKFGDGKTSIEKNPKHDYPGPGAYDACLITDNGCGKDTLCQKVEIASILSAAFSSDKISGCSPLTVQYKNLSTGASSFYWSFPGGTPSTSNDPNPIIIYNSRGSYDAKLVAYSGNDSITNSKNSYITVQSLPTAKFTSEVTKLVVKFNNQSLYGSSYLWKFGDNSTSTEQNPEHDFKAEGEYDVELIVTNECGDTKISKKVTVLLVPKVNFTSSATNICVGDYIDLQDLSSNDVLEWNWQIENGTPANSKEKNPRIRFEKAGLYSIKLTVKNTNGENSIIKTSYILVKSPVQCPKHNGKNNKAEATEEDEEQIVNGRSRVNSRSLSIQPNPTNGLITITLPNDFDYTNGILQVYNMNGIKESINQEYLSNNQIQINLNSLLDGIYFIKATDKNIETVTKVVLLK